MKTLLLLASSLALPPLLPTAGAQALPKVVTTIKNDQPKAVVQRRTAAQRAANYKGPKVVPDSKKLGREFIHDSKHAPEVVSPVKQ